MFRCVILFCAVFALVTGETTQVNRCTVHSGELPINAYIEGCVTPPCNLPQLQDVVINIVFRAPRTMHNMRTLATAMLFLLPIPYDLGENAVTCNFLTNSYCPVEEGQVVQYVFRMYIESLFPVNTQANFEFRIVDDNNDSIMCIRVPMRIVPPVDSKLGVGGQNSTITIEV